MDEAKVRFPLQSEIKLLKFLLFLMKRIVNVLSADTFPGNHPHHNGLFFFGDLNLTFRVDCKEHV